MMSSAPQGVTLVINAGNVLGWRCIENLLKDRHTIRATDKSQERLDALKRRLASSGSGKEIETQVIDLMRPDVLPPMFRDVRRVLFIVGNNPQREAQARNVLEVAKREAKDRLEQIVLMSVYGARNRDITMQKQLSAVEELLRATGLPFTILGPCIFQETITHYFADEISRGVLPLPVSDENVRLCFVAVREIAEANQKVMSNPRDHIGQTYSFTGPEMYSGRELAQMFAQAINRDVMFKSVKPTETMEHLMSVGSWTRDQAMNIVEFIQWQTTKGHLQAPSTDSQRLGVRPYPFKELIQEERDNLAAGKNVRDNL